MTCESFELYGKRVKLFNNNVNSESANNLMEAIVHYQLFAIKQEGFSRLIANG